ncbi:hypothetical protein NW752_010863 [Fusarium irregulare]|nr:hypothetical protein NW752_010863 [Fusarium irregulare]
MAKGQAIPRLLMTSWKQTVQRPGPEPFPTNRRVASQPTPDLDVEPSIPRYRIKRGRQHEDVLDEVVNLDPESKRRRPLPGKEPSHGSHTEQPDADFARLTQQYTQVFVRGRSHMSEHHSVPRSESLPTFCSRGREIPQASVRTEGLL